MPVEPSRPILHHFTQAQHRYERGHLANGLLREDGSDAAVDFPPESLLVPVRFSLRINGIGRWADDSTASRSRPTGTAAPPVKPNT